MATRLDRLFLLLENGSTPLVRKSAAKQLGQVQKLYPHEFNNLISKVHVYLTSNNWDTRIAAGQAIEAITGNVPQWDPKPAVKKEEDDDASGGTGQLTFSQFNIERILKHGSSLLGSEGAEYDAEEIDPNNKDLIAKQKQLLNKRLGLDVAGGLGIAGADELFREEDLLPTSDRNSPVTLTTPVSELMPRQTKGSMDSEMSARERNRAKRKARLLAKNSSKEEKSTNGNNSDSEPSAKKRKTATAVVEQPGQEGKILVDSVPDNTMNTDEMDEWPFDAFCDLLMNDLFASSWERRHGGATGLREVIKLHGIGAGRSVHHTASQMEVEHQRWLEDVALRLICVLALDRFGDFVSDEVVAPVRETCAQTLGVTMKHMTAPSIGNVLKVLLQLLTQPHWEVRHGGLLGIKYLLVVRKDLVEDILPTVLPALYGCLQDKDDDARAVSAAAILPITDVIFSTQPQQVDRIISCLWDTLLDLDDLTASTNSIMSLLATLLAHPITAADISNHCRSEPRSLSVLVPRLWPFLRHNIASVRRAALQTLNTLLNNSNKQDGVGADWVVPLLQDGLRHIFQRSLTEEKSDILTDVQEVWTSIVRCIPAHTLAEAALPWMGAWMALLMQPHSVPFDANLLIHAKHVEREGTPSKLRHASNPYLQQLQQQIKEQQEFIGGRNTVIESHAKRDASVIQARRTGCRLLGELIGQLSVVTTVTAGETEAPLAVVARLLMFHLSGKSAVQRMTAAMVTMEWASIQQPCLCPVEVRTKLQECLVEPIYFDEIALSFTRMQTECRDFMASFKQAELPLEGVLPGAVLTLEQAEMLVSSVYEEFSAKLKPRLRPMFEQRRSSLQVTISQTANQQLTLSNRVMSCLSGACVLLHSMPEKLNPVIRPLMDTLKKEQNYIIQEMAARSLSRLLEVSISRTPCPNAKVIRNLQTALCSDAAFTPQIHAMATSKSGDSLKEATCDKNSGILTIDTQQKILERTATGRRGPSAATSGARKLASQLSVDLPIESILQEEDEAKRQVLVQRRGATLALKVVVQDGGVALVTKMAYLWDAVCGFLEKTQTELLKEEGEAQELVNNLQTMEACAPAVSPKLHNKILDSLPHLCVCLHNKWTAVRHLASRCVGMMARLKTLDTMNVVMETLLPWLGASHDVTKRQGAIEALANLIDSLGVDIVPYIVLLVVPVMGCMSDHDNSVRLLATHCFASLIRLMPLEAGIPNPPEMKRCLVERKESERRFLEQLLDPTKLETFSVPVTIKAQLRQYQQDGVNWLWFLNKYKLHGILCDDMGLGKTLQSICILSGDHHNRAIAHKKTQSDDCAPLPSLVVCPPTLTGHWVYEVEKFVDPEYLNPLHYTGPPNERTRLQGYAKNYNLVVASYDVVRNDIDFFGKIKWNYCILDEGHIIKNSKTKLSKAVKQIRCNHRLILSGTPIQNNVLELWSLFDFLMPGFLGTEKQFQTRYGKPILQSKDAKSSSKEQEAGALAMEALHRQVLPFLLRRMKEDVLKDLPPKIIQDYYCDLSPLQVRLYEDFAKSRAKQSVDESLSETEKPAAPQGTTHIFQALQYLRKVSNHPSLVLTPKHPEYEKLSAELKEQKTPIRDIQHAPKLTALRQLLNDCGIGTGETDVVNQHRVLLFCQLKSMLDIVENDLLKNLMTSVTYLRLDGSVPAGQRHGIVNKFNNDPSIDVLLLTTHVGGLGLNLTGADTVIFVEHDWNPMKDLQAMDRAHRIGQKKVVNVYRLISRGTLEEKIMGLQKFKMNIANTVITQDNSSLVSMATDQLLDLFSLDTDVTQPGGAKTAPSSQVGGASMKNILEGMEELWDEKQYESEYNLDSFMQSLQK